MDYLDWGNTLRVDGTGYSFNLGVIVRPADYLRLGVAYNSPIWYKMTLIGDMPIRIMKTIRRIRM